MRRLLPNLALLAGSILFSLLLVEGALRLLGFYPSFATPDPTIGPRWLAHAPYRYSLEGFSQGRMNAAGWRDRDYSEKKPVGTRRILFLGDSFVAALEVPLDSTFHKRLERQLNARALPGHGTEVIALGQGGMGTTQEYLTYRKWGVAYDPDVVAVLFILNDCGDNWRWPGPGMLRPYFVEDGDSLRLDMSFAETPEYRYLARMAPFKQHSSLVTVAAKIRQDFGARFHPDPAQAGFSGPHGWYTTWNFDKSPPVDSIPAFGLTEKILARFAREVQRDGRRFVLFAAGAAEQEARECLIRRSGDPNFDPDKTQQWLVSVGARNGFEVVPLTPTFRSVCAVDGRRLWWGSGDRYGHWNSAGHAVASDVMARYFTSRPEGLESAPAAGARFRAR
ncbi:MAG: SGNH/GDSL hydrolase family protein [Candidatus Eisenbacteria bacterium]|nr:SGNH/GDSL hydrolase family protein [Candidatus Eisenbacteria bacterium]